jgi:murein DD-endopeptidase MepM/ murein hydrolase activator NlpD
MRARACFDHHAALWLLAIALPWCLFDAALAAGGEDLQSREPAVGVRSGGGPLVPPAHGDPLSAARRQAVLDRFAEARTRLEAGRRRGASPALVFPLAPWNGLADPGFFGRWNFLDHDPGYPNQLSDYTCGQRTYDTDAGFNHPGTDWGLWPFAWNKMDSDQVAVVAVAGGTLVFKEDGHPDRQCEFDLSAPTNEIGVMHDDGTAAYYLHFKAGSLTSKTVGETVAAGEYLGIVGSSGSSTGPHLHLETYDTDGTLVDPFAGSCNTPPGGGSWWAIQRPYYDSAVNALTVGSAPPDVLPPCPQPEQPNEATSFSPDSYVYVGVYFREILSSQTAHASVYLPDGSLWWSTDHSVGPDPYYVGWYWWWEMYFPFFAPEGVYRFEVVFEGETYTRMFTIGSGGPAGRVPGQEPGDVPLRVALAPDGDLQLTWDTSCAAGDDDYAVYEGPIGSFADHMPVLCDTGGLTEATITPAGGDRYYLVVPGNSGFEGSHGRDSAGVERATGPAACRDQQVGACP